MLFEARLVTILPEQSGNGKNGIWKKQDIIVETDGQYPKKVCVSLWGDKFDKSLLQPGCRLAVSCDIESREFNGKWYTDVKAWKIERSGDSDPSFSSKGAGVPPSYQMPPQTGNNTGLSDDDTPF